MEAESGNSRAFEQRGKASPFSGDTDAVVHDVRGYFGRRNAEGEISCSSQNKIAALQTLPPSHGLRLSDAVLV